MRTILPFENNHTLPAFVGLFFVSNPKNGLLEEHQVLMEGQIVLHTRVKAPSCDDGDDVGEGGQNVSHTSLEAPCRYAHTLSAF